MPTGARVALESTLLTHGVPRATAIPLAQQLRELVRHAGAEACLVAVIDGEPITSVSDAQLASLLNTPDLQKLNSANLTLAMHRKRSGSTTVSATAAIAYGDGIRVFATGGLGGIHRNMAAGLDVSSDLGALATTPIAVVASGVKSLLDVHATREALEALGVPVVGYRTDVFPAFYLRSATPAIGVDERFDDAADLAGFLRVHLNRSRTAVVVANPVPAEEEIAAETLDDWLEQAHGRARASAVSGRGVTPFVLKELHELSNGATLRANIALIKSNASLAASLAVQLGSR